MMDKNIILQTKGIDKFFGPTHANKNIDFTLMKGEIRGLAGENGSGKSTLLSQIAGIKQSDGGIMYLNGKEYSPSSPIDANENGISIVVQELGLVGVLPAGVNVFLGKTKKFSKFGTVSLKKIYESANAELSKWDLPNIAFHKMAGDMNVESRKMVELARALSADPQILILDEVTQALSHDNREKLYELIKKFKAMGRSVILISHDIEEIVDITDSISILRDGELITTVNSADITVDILKTKMVGRELEEKFYRTDECASYEPEIALSVKNVSTDEGIDDVSFDVHKGEILGFCGLSDSGIHSIGRAVYGITKLKQGTVTLNSKNINITKSTQALRNGMGYVPKDRDGEALMMSASIRDNFTVPSSNELKGNLDYLSGRKTNDMAEKAKDQFNVKCTGIFQPMSDLSGGNKQKVNLGRWLIKDLSVLVIDSPARGVDVGVKAYIYDCLIKAKEEGLGIILITDELPEAIGMCDNIIVMRNGKIVGQIEREARVCEESIIEVMI